MIRFVFAVFGLIGARNEKSRLLALPSSREGRRPAWRSRTRRRPAFP
jgi:hypothetical protein